MTGPTAAVRRLVVERDQGQCQWCGNWIRTGAYSLQHRLPRGMGGSSAPWVNLPGNLITVHGTGTTGCHGRIEEKRDRSVHLGFLVRRGQYRPAEVPVYAVSPFGGFGWALLADDGGRAWLSQGDAAELMRRLGVWADEDVLDARR